MRSAIAVPPVADPNGPMMAGLNSESKKRATMNITVYAPRIASNGIPANFFLHIAGADSNRAFFVHGSAIPAKPSSMNATISRKVRFTGARIVGRKAKNINATIDITAVRIMARTGLWNLSLTEARAEGKARSKDHARIWREAIM